MNLKHYLKNIKIFLKLIMKENKEVYFKNLQREEHILIKIKENLLMFAFGLIDLSQNQDLFKFLIKNLNDSI